MRGRPLPGALFALIAGACASPSGEGSPGLILGTGVLAFVPVSNGEPLTIYAGPQGGHHVWLALRTRGLDTTSEVANWLVTEAGSPVTSGQQRLLLTALSDQAPSDAFLPDGGASGWSEALAVKIVLPETLLAALDGQSVHVSMTVSDGHGRSVVATLDLVLRNS